MGDQNVKRVALFGATGSIGRQSLDVISRLDDFRVVLLSAGSNARSLVELAHRYRPQVVCIASADSAPEVRRELDGSDIKVYAGEESLRAAAAGEDYDLCLNALVGVAGLPPTYEAVGRGLTVALANKESLVLAGELLNRMCAAGGARIVPIDSEHSAILQCLQGESPEDVKRLILTASGGPFRDWSPADIPNATPEQALQHPTWKMGRKITIDSATLVNKGLEVIEARHLFSLPPKKIDAVLHPQSVVHSMVEFRDGSIKAQLGSPDMRIPIQYALTGPRRRELELNAPGPLEWGTLEFRPVDLERYPCFGLARRALETGGTAPAVLNGADEAAVELFLRGELRFGGIAAALEYALDRHRAVSADDLDAVLAADDEGRRCVREFANATTEDKRGTKI